MTVISLLSHTFYDTFGWKMSLPAPKWLSFILIWALLWSDTRVVSTAIKWRFTFRSEANSAGAEQSNERARLRLSAAFIFISSRH